MRVVKAIVGKRVIPVQAVAVWGPCPTRAGYFPGLRAYLDEIDGDDNWDCLDDDYDDEDDDEDDDEIFEPYPDGDTYCPRCGEVLAGLVDASGQLYDLCNHCGYNTRQAIGG